MSFNNNSRHHLPINSMLFQSTTDLRRPLPNNATLVNLLDAADLDVTALPTPTPVAAEPPVMRKASVWQRVLAKIKALLGGRKTGEEKEMEIGEPTGFQHHVTGGDGPLRMMVGDGRRRGGE